MATEDRYGPRAPEYVPRGEVVGTATAELVGPAAVPPVPLSPVDLRAQPAGTFQPGGPEAEALRLGYSRAAAGAGGRSFVVTHLRVGGYGAGEVVTDRQLGVAVGCDLERLLRLGAVRPATDAEVLAARATGQPVTLTTAPEAPASYEEREASLVREVERLNREKAALEAEKGELLVAGSRVRGLEPTDAQARRVLEKDEEIRELRRRLHELEAGLYPAAGQPEPPNEAPKG
jgi:hypothetical protein